MDNFVVTAAGMAREPDARAARLGARFGRLDLLSQLAVLAVESLGLDFATLPRDRIAICLAARMGSLATDFDYWMAREAAGGPSPTLFAYTLPSAPIGEIAIRWKLRGPNLCFVGDDAPLLTEAADLLQRGDAAGCLCLSCGVVTDLAAARTGEKPEAGACALFLTRGTGGHPLPEINRDIRSICALVCARKPASH